MYIILSRVKSASDPSRFLSAPNFELVAMLLLCCCCYGLSLSLIDKYISYY